MLHQDSPPLKLLIVQKLPLKVFALIFWEMEGIILVKCLHPKATITRPYYSAILMKSRNALAQTSKVSKVIKENKTHCTVQIVPPATRRDDYLFCYLEKSHFITLNNEYKNEIAGKYQASRRLYSGSTLARNLLILHRIFERKKLFNMYIIHRYAALITLFNFRNLIISYFNVC